MCCSSESIFPWVGAVLINLGFNALIAWGLSQVWVLGVSLCGLYTIVLYVLARWLQRTEHEAEETMPLVVEASEAASRRASDRAENPQQEVSLPVNLLLGLAILSFGTTLLLLSINIHGICTFEYNSPLTDAYMWKTNLTNVPEAVKSWALKDDTIIPQEGPTFAYINATGVTIFAGADGRTKDRSTLWAVKSNMPPEKHSEVSSPAYFVAVTGSTACLVGFDGRGEARQRIFCTEGDNTRMAEPIGPNSNTGFIGSLLPNNGLLWFKRSYIPSASGNLIYSLDPNEMTFNLFSFKKKVKREGIRPDCNDSDYNQRLKLLILFAAAIPFLVASISFWYFEATPSMAFNSYIGCTAVYVLIRDQSDPEWLTDNPDALDTWFAGTSVFGILLATYFNLSNRTRYSQRPPLQWLLTILGIPYAFGMIQVLDLSNDFFHDWLLVNIIVFAPWLLFGLANENKFLVFLAGVGFLADAVRLAGFVGGKAGEKAGGPLSFLVFAMAGLGVGFVGYKMSQIQPKVYNAGAAIVAKFDARFRPGTGLNSSAAPDDNKSFPTQDQLTITEDDHDLADSPRSKNSPF